MSAFNYVFHIHPYISFYLTYLSNLCQSNLPSFKRIHNLKAHFGSGSGSHRFASLCIGSLEAPEDRTEKDSKLCSAWNWTGHAQSAVGSAVVGAEDPRRKRNFQLRNSSILTRYRVGFAMSCHRERYVAYVYRWGVIHTWKWGALNVNSDHFMHSLPSFRAGRSTRQT